MATFDGKLNQYGEGVGIPGFAEDERDAAADAITPLATLNPMHGFEKQPGGLVPFKSIQAFDPLIKHV